MMQKSGFLRAILAASSIAILGGAITARAESGADLKQAIMLAHDAQIVVNAEFRLVGETLAMQQVRGALSDAQVSQAFAGRTHAILSARLTRASYNAVVAEHRAEAARYFDAIATAIATSKTWPASQSAASWLSFARLRLAETRQEYEDDLAKGWDPALSLKGAYCVLAFSHGLAKVEVTPFDNIEYLASQATPRIAGDANTLMASIKPVAAPAVVIRVAAAPPESPPTPPLPTLAPALSKLSAPVLAPKPSKNIAYRYRIIHGFLSLHVSADGRVSGSNENVDHPDRNGTWTGRATRMMSISGIWTQPVSDVRCSSKKNGSWYWGKYSITNYSTPAASGMETHCDDAQWGSMQLSLIPR